MDIQISDIENRVVVVNRAKSSISRVKKKKKISFPEAPSCCRPLLFLKLMVDIDKNARHSFVSFVDDSEISMNIASPEVTKKMQEDTSSVFQWAGENNMTFNSDKF